jgi:hypothetical protein
MKTAHSTGAVLFAADSARGILTFKNVNIAHATFQMSPTIGTTQSAN